MLQLSNDRDALDFVAQRIAYEANLDGIPFSETERKMLYFSETARTLPEIWQVNEDFIANYDESEYEKKVSRLINTSVNRARIQDMEEFKNWTEAIRQLRRKDHYLIVMIDQAKLGRAFSRTTPFNIPRRLWIPVVGLLLFASGVFFVLNKFFPPPMAIGKSGTYHRDYSFAFWLTSMAVIGLGGIFQLLMRFPKINNIFNVAIAQIFGKRHRRTKARPY